MTVKGKKLSAQQSSKDKFRELEASLENIQMASRISQMMIKQILEQLQTIRRDTDNTMGVVNDLQYRTLAILELGNLDKKKLNDLAQEYKLNDYSRASDQEDAIKGYELDNDGVVTENSVVIITSSTNGDEDKGIFRSKFKMSDCQLESLRQKLLGSQVGSSFEETISNDLHKITVLGIRKIISQEQEQGIKE